MSLSIQEHPQHQDRFFKALVQNNPVAIITSDLDHRIVACNPAFERLFGYQEDEVRGRYIDPLISSPETYAEAAEFTQRVIAAKPFTPRGGGARKTAVRHMLKFKPSL